MNIFLKRAIEIENDTIADRIFVKEHPEYGLELPLTVEFVKERLKAYGCENIQEMGGGVVCTLGHGSNALLLRADMAAEPVRAEERRKESVASHVRGHDSHTAMLLSAARMLKEREDELGGVVKIAFQAGAFDVCASELMIDEGLLEDPRVNAAVGVYNAQRAPGVMEYSKARTKTQLRFSINVAGRRADSDAPYKGASALSAAAAIVNACERVPFMELKDRDGAVISFEDIYTDGGRGELPANAVLKGAIYAYENETADDLFGRLSSAAGLTAETFRCRAEISRRTVPAFKNDEELCDELSLCLKDVCGRNNLKLLDGDMHTTDDFSQLGLRVPAMYFGIGMQGNNEDGLKYGAACLANCAYCWLIDHYGE